MSSLRFRARIFLAALLSFAALGAAEARDNGLRQGGAHHQARDFYAVAPSAAEEAPAVESHSCFTTNSPTEATRGIRHWSGRC